MGEGNGGTPRETFHELLRRARGGHREALGKLLDAFRRVLLHRAQRHEPMGLRPKCAPSDLVQETLLEAQRDFECFRGETPEELASWLTRILNNNLGDLLRYQACRRRDLRLELPLEDAEATGDLKEQLPDARPNPEQEAFSRERQEAIRRALRELSGRSREAVRLRYEEKLRFEEVGARIGCSAEAARKLCTRAIREIQVSVSDLRDDPR
jgi:RNA polymerase sigma-70 factor (subfamily 1)